MMMWIVLMKILMNTVQIITQNMIAFDDTIVDMLNKKKTQSNSDIIIY